MASNSSQTISVVDDEPVIASTLAAILNASGFQATAFLDAESALEAAESVKPTLLITDVVMPGMNGIELAIKFRSVCPACKVLLFSGQAATADLLEVARKAGHDFKLLEKPIHPKELLAAIRAA